LPPRYSNLGRRLKRRPYERGRPTLRFCGIDMKI
jgi:hypothetical protein